MDEVCGCSCCVYYCGTALASWRQIITVGFCMHFVLEAGIADAMCHFSLFNTHGHSTPFMSHVSNIVVNAVSFISYELELLCACDDC